MKTLQPLHFEDLEPHRFEDLIRQLIYDFREWRELEATGRSGSDEGFDVRGWEVVHLDDIYEQEEDESEKPIEADRIWLIQCKREKSITPKKLQDYLAEVLKGKKDQLYGIIFVAPSEFSKKARDAYRATCREYGINEIYLWGRTELEDMLFQPKNDHLLFAYFGISLLVRRRSLRTRLNSILTIKRKAIKYLGSVAKNSFRPVLLRDPEETRYPFRGEIKDFEKHPRWKMYYFVGHYEAGLLFLTRKYFAYISDDKIHWDIIESVDEARPHIDPWKNDKENNRMDAYNFWFELPEANRAWVEFIRLVPYDKIIAIDENGDVHVHEPHIYVPFDRENGPFERGAYVKLLPSVAGSEEIHVKPENRIKFFPPTFPCQTKESKEKKKEEL